MEEILLMSSIHVFVPLWSVFMSENQVSGPSNMNKKH